MKKIIFLFIFIILSIGLYSDEPSHNLIIEVESARINDFKADFIKINDISFKIKPLFEEGYRGPNLFILIPERRTEKTAWDLAHKVIAENPSITHAEPDEIKVPREYKETEKKRGESSYDDDWPHPSPSEFAWHLGDDFSQLRKALLHIAVKGKIVRVAHFDTGYDPNHISKPKNLNTQLQRNFIEDEDKYSAADPYSEGIAYQPGHGTNTIAILAGNYINRHDYKGFVGGVPFANIVPVRLDKSVILYKSSAFVKAIYYIMENDCDVLSMSMGGVASKYWADAVNAAYEKGVVLVTAAGNNFNGLPTRNLIYPAKFHRVIAACGVTYAKTPYYKSGIWPVKMQGNFGPDNFMGTAIAAYTPNIIGANWGSGDEFDYDFGGTSSATPQIAAAAAIWIQKNNNFNYTYPWQRVNAVMNALFTSADKNVADCRKYYGNGLLRAYEALKVAPKLDANPIPKDDVNFPILSILFGWESRSTTTKMFEIEMLQHEQNNKKLQEVLSEIKGEITAEQRIKIRDAVINIPEASEALKNLMYQIK